MMKYVFIGVEEPEPEPQDAASFGRSRNAMSSGSDGFGSDNGIKHS
jgi:hypothetical protein